MSTSIEWTDVTDNIITVKGGGWWCRKISPGCANCYAAMINQSSYFGGNKLAYSGNPPVLELNIEKIGGWARQTKPKKHFVASMTDIFGEWVGYPIVTLFLDGMLAAPKQTFQMLTKRPAIAAEWINRWLTERGLEKLPSHMWIGASCEDQPRANERIKELLKVKASFRFLSVEPMLEPIDFPTAAPCGYYCDHDEHGGGHRPGHGLSGIHWIIFGGESGPRSRPCNVDWIRDGLRQCRAGGVAAFVKQLGKHVMTDNANMDDWPDETELIGQGEGFAAARAKLKHPKGGDWSEWPEQLKVREFPVLT